MYIHVWSLVVLSDLFTYIKFFKYIVLTYSNLVSLTIQTLAHALSVLDEVDMGVELTILLFYPCVFRDRVVCYHCPSSNFCGVHTRVFVLEYIS